MTWNRNTGIMSLFGPTGTVQLLKCKKTMGAAVELGQCAQVWLQWETTARSGFIVIRQESSMKCDCVVEWTQRPVFYFFLCVCVCMCVWALASSHARWGTSGVCGCKPRNLMMFLLEQRENSNIAQKVWEQSKRQTNTSLQQVESELWVNRAQVSHTTSAKKGLALDALQSVYEKHNKQQRPGLRGRERTEKDVYRW